MQHAPKSTRGRLFFAAAIFLAVMAPSGALLYVTFTAGEDATAAWFDDLGYGGIFLANLASTATLFIPVPGLTAAAQALIVSSGQILSPFWVGVAGGLGMPSARSPLMSLAWPRLLLFARRRSVLHGAFSL